MINDENTTIFCKIKLRYHVNLSIYDLNESMTKFMGTKLVDGGILRWCMHSGQDHNQSVEPLCFFSEKGMFHTTLGLIATATKIVYQDCPPNSQESSKCKVHAWLCVHP